MGIKGVDGTSCTVKPTCSADTRRPCVRVSAPVERLITHSAAEQFGRGEEGSE